MAGRRCPGPLCPTILTGTQRYCPRHATEYEARRGTPKQRGYDSSHNAQRRAIQARIDLGETVCCWRCGTRITGRVWDLGHDDHDRTITRGAECQPCNRSAGGAQGRARQG